MADGDDLSRTAVSAYGGSQSESQRRAAEIRVDPSQQYSIYSSSREQQATTLLLLSLLLLCCLLLC